MSTTIPENIRTTIRARVWAKADELDWWHLSPQERAAWYEIWSKDREIAGELSLFMDSRRIRVYIKDSILKPYLLLKGRKDWPNVAAALHLPSDASTRRTFSKPHGVALADGRVISWGSSRDWKLILLSVFERTRLSPGLEPFGAVLVDGSKTADELTRRLAEDLSARLDITKLVWID